MELPLSCPLADLDDADSRFEAILVRSIHFGCGDVRTPLRSVSFNGRDSVKAPSAEMENDMCDGCVCSKTREVGDQLPRSDGLSERGHQSPLPDPKKHRYQAALKLQKVYKSFRTRRQLADCAVLVEQRWWKLLDFAELKQSSISFFDIEKPESAVSRWSRARTRAAKVGKGLSQDEKARKLALQHWLEAIDPRHRYGHNLQFYYVKWLQCESQQPFFYWLDIGEGKEVSLERCSRSKLQQQCIKYLSPAERKAYEVVVRHGKFLYKQSDEVLDTTTGAKDGKWIFVLSASRSLYVGQKSKGTFQHSSFLAGGAALSAGRLVVEDGILKAIWPHSGHYLPTEENFQEFISFLKEHNVDLTNVQKSPSEEEHENPNEKANDNCLHSNSSRSHLLEVNTESVSENFVAQVYQDCNAKTRSTKSSLSRLSRETSSKVARLEIPCHSGVLDNSNRKEALPSGCHTQPPDPSEDGYGTAEDSLLSDEEFMVPKSNLFDEDPEEGEEQAIPKEKILQRIDSHKRLNSYQLAHQLSSRWATGAGPRIGCMRDYPSELQFRVLEHANLSPRSTTFSASPRNISPLHPKAPDSNLLL